MTGSSPATTPASRSSSNRRDRSPAARRAGVSARLVGDAVLPDGRRAVPVFQLVAERYLDPGYAPEAVAETCGISAATIRRLAAEMARAAFEGEIELAVPWTDGGG